MLHKNSMKRIILLIIAAHITVWSQGSGTFLDRLFPSRDQISKQKSSAALYSKLSGRQAGNLSKRNSLSSASISGTVHNSDSSAAADTAGSLVAVHPVNYAVVTVTDTFGYEIAKKRCASDGQYTVEIPYPGTYCLWANSQNFSGQENRTFFGNTGDFSKATWIRVSSGEHLTGKDIRLGAGAGKKGVVIYGRCFIGSDTATLLPAASISFRFKPSDPVKTVGFPSYNLYKWFSTKSDGAYCCTTSLDPGGYYIQVERNARYASGSDTVVIPQWLDGESVTSEPVAVPLSAPQTEKNIHFSSGTVISGSLRDESSDSLQGSVTLEIIDKDGYTLASSYCYADTRNFSFIGLPPGSYYLYVSAGSNGSYSSFYYPYARQRDSAQAISSGAGGAQERVEIVLKRTPTDVPSTIPRGKIRGRITREDNGAPVPLARVRMGSAISGADTSVRADSTGWYEASVPADSTMVVSALQPDDAYGDDFTADCYLAQTYYPGTSSPSAAAGVKVAPNETKQIDLALVKGGGLAGWLKDARGEKVPGINSIGSAGVFLFGLAWKQDFGTFTSTTISDDAGGFRFTGMEPGSYSVRFIAGGGIVNLPYLPEYCFAGIASQTVTRENTAFSQVLSMPRATATIKGACEPVNGRQDFANGEGSYVYCYSGDSVIAALSLFHGSGMQSARSLFLSWEPMRSTGPQHFTIGKLPAGKYALARYAVRSDDKIIMRQWYSTPTFEKIELSDYKKFYREYIKPGIPANAWITLADGETKTDVNFGNVGAISPGMPANAEGRLMLVRGVGRRSDVFHYYLPMPGSQNPGELNVYKPDGTKVRTIRLTAQSGEAVWDRREGGGRGVCSGVYVFRLSQGDKTAVVKDAVVR